MQWFRRLYGARWISDHVPPSWYGVKNKPVGQAAWTRMAAVRYAKEMGLSAMASLFDVTKCFDNIRLDIAIPVLSTTWLSWQYAQGYCQYVSDGAPRYCQQCGCWQEHA